VVKSIGPKVILGHLVPVKVELEPKSLPRHQTCRFGLRPVGPGSACGQNWARAHPCRSRGGSVGLEAIFGVGLRLVIQCSSNIELSSRMKFGSSKVGQLNPIFLVLLVYIQNAPNRVISAQITQNTPK